MSLQDLTLDKLAKNLPDSVMTELIQRIKPDPWIFSSRDNFPKKYISYLIPFYGENLYEQVLSHENIMRDFLSISKFNSNWCRNEIFYILSWNHPLTWEGILDFLEGHESITLTKFGINSDDLDLDIDHVPDIPFPFQFNETEKRLQSLNLNLDLDGFSQFLNLIDHYNPYKNKTLIEDYHEYQNDPDRDYRFY